jgi:hypothetical protein
MKWLLALFRRRKPKCGCYLDAVTGVYIDPHCAERNKK